MTPGLLILLLGGGAVAVWIATTPGGLSSVFSGGLTGQGGGDLVPVNDAGRPFLNADQVNYYTSGFVKHFTNAEAALLGAQAGAPVAIATFGIAPAIGALVAWTLNRNSNDTKEDRLVFASRLGFTGPGGNSLGIHTDVPTGPDDLSKGLYAYLIYAGFPELTETAMHVIGRKDFEGNADWMLRVLVALWRVNFKFSG